MAVARAKGCEAAGGFTLIELLVVVAILAILAAIALPNFLEAQTRAKVARIQSDMRTLATALESYSVDHTSYPPRRDGTQWMPRFDTQWRDMSRLTTPIGYISTLPLDIFDRSGYRNRTPIEYLDPVQTTNLVRGAQGLSRTTYNSVTNWSLISVGPDGYIGVLQSGQPGGYPRQPYNVAWTLYRVYDPTNGTNSVGNIFRFREAQDPAKLLRLAPRP